MTGTAYVYLDNLMLTKGTGMASYNFVEFGGFESTGLSASVSDFWGSSATLVYTNAALLGNSLSITSSGVASTSQIKQRIFESTSGFIPDSEYKFLVSGYGKSENAVVGTYAKFAIRIDVGYYNNAGSLKAKSFYFDFNPYANDWQYVSGIFTVLKNDEDNNYNSVRYIDVVCDLSGQPNAYALFDNISVINATEYDGLKYDYYDNGNLKSVSGFNEIETKSRLELRKFSSKYEFSEFLMRAEPWGERI